MTDEVDHAMEVQDLLTSKAILEIRKNSNKLEALATGQCLFCDAPLPTGVRWCGKECRDDWQKDNNYD